MHLKRFSIFSICLLLGLTTFLPLSAEKLLSLTGVPTQGSLLRGEVAPSVQEVWLDGEKLHLIGRKFLIGFDRDAELEHYIRIDYANHSETIKFDLAKYRYDIQKITHVQKRFVIPPTDNFTRNKIKLESETMKTIRKQIGNNHFFYADSVLIRPVEKGWISSSFGGQRIINGTPQSPHNGLDIAVPFGTEIKAMTSGIVALTGDFYYNGKFVLIDHGGGLSSIYLHMSRVSVKKGDYVKTGDKIGEVGSTGRSTGNHLHWGVNLYEKRINPALLLKSQEEFLIFSDENP